MATFDLHPLAVEPTSRNVELLRSLGSLALLASPMTLVAYGVSALVAKEWSSGPLVGLLGFVHCLGWLCSLAGLYLTGAMGRGQFGRRLLGLQSVLVAAAAVWSIGEHALPGSGDSGLPFAPGDAAWPLSHLGMLVVGAVFLRAGSWTGWASFAPLLCGLALPVALLASGTAWNGTTSLASGLTTGLSFALLAWAVRTSGARLELAHSTASS